MVNQLVFHMFYLSLFLIGCEQNNTYRPKNLKPTAKIQIDTSVSVINGTNIQEQVHIL